MRVRTWRDIVEEVVEADANPDDWRAVGGDRAGGIGEDMYLAHGDVGVYQLKTYAKNPFQVHGVGTQVARKVDGDLDPIFPRDEGGRFAVQSPADDESEAERRATDVEEVVKAHADAPTRPSDLFDDMMAALDSPAFGPLEFDPYGRPEGVDDLAATFEDAQEALEAEFEEIVEDDEVGRGFM